MLHHSLQILYASLIPNGTFDFSTGLNNRRSILHTLTQFTQHEVYHHNSNVMNRNKQKKSSDLNDSTDISMLIKMNMSKQTSSSEKIFPWQLQELNSEWWKNKKKDKSNYPKESRVLRHWARRWFH